MDGMELGSKSVGDQVYRILHDNIINLNLVPGAFMSEKDISEKMNVSRTPVREAFIKLSREGLVNIYPQKGTFVSKINLSQAREERFLRESIEKAVYEVVVKERTEECILRLERCIEKQKQALKDDSIVKFMEYDEQFHKIIFDEAKKPMCYGIIIGVSSNYRRIRLLSVRDKAVMVLNLSQHEEIFKAIKERDLLKSTSILREHLRKLLTESDEICERNPEYFESVTGYKVINLFSDGANS